MYFDWCIICSRGHSCMRMAVEKPHPPVFSYKFQGIFNANAFSELAVYTESKMISFTSGPLQGFRLFFYQVNFAHSRQGDGDD